MCGDCSSVVRRRCWRSGRRRPHRRRTQAGGVRGHTPHKIRMVKVAPGVELEVLDWGGTGKAMVLLTGLGDNAHVYDQFAFQFTDYFHVIGITRRGYLPSSQPRDRLRRSDQGGGRHRGARCLGHRQGRIRRAFAGRLGTERAGTEAIRRGSTSWSIWMLPTCRNASCPRASSRLYPLYRRGPEVVVGLSGCHGAVAGTPRAGPGCLPRAEVRRKRSNRGFHDTGLGPKKINRGCRGDSADELGKHQGAAARHLRSIHT